MQLYKSACGQYSVQFEQTDKGAYVNEFAGGELTGTSGPWSPEKAEAKLAKILKFYSREGLPCTRVQ